VNYQPGSFGYDAGGRHLRVLDLYVRARQAAANGLLSAEEAMSTSDFPTYMTKFFRHNFQARINEVQGSWEQYTADFSVDDFETYTSSRWGRFPDIPEKSLNGPYEELAIKELPGPSISLREFGASFALTRQLILSDRLREIAKLPNLFAEAMARTQSKEAAINQFQSNPTMWDGNALFSAQHANTGTTALTADVPGMNALIAAEQAIDAQVDGEGYPINMAGNTHTLIIPKALRWVAAALNTRDTIPNSVGTPTVLLANQVAGRYNIIEEPFFTDATNWYMSIDLKGELAFLAYVTLNGQRTPFLGLKDPGVRAVLGGEDPYSFDFDEVAYKIRHDFNYIPIEWRGIYGSIVAG
jgi:hypothetical protein